MRTIERQILLFALIIFAVLLAYQEPTITGQPILWTLNTEEDIVIDDLPPGVYTNDLDVDALQPGIYTAKETAVDSLDKLRFE